MSEKKRWLKVVCIVAGALVLLALLGFILLRIYAKYGAFDLSYQATVWEEYLEKNPREVLSVCDEGVQIRISEDLLNTLITESLVYDEKDQIESLVYRCKEKEVHLNIRTGMGVYPVKALASLSVVNNKLQICMEDFRLGDRGIDMPDSVLGETLIWEVNLQNLLPNWISVQKVWGDEEIVLQAKVFWDKVAEKMQPLLENIRQDYLEIAVQTGAPSLLKSMHAHYREGKLTPTFARELVEDFLTEQRHLYSILAILEETAVTKIFSEYVNWLKEEPNYGLTAQMQAEYQLQVRVWVARHMLEQLQGEFARGEEMVPVYSVQGTPYHPIKEQLYDERWLQTQTSLEEFYQEYLTRMRYYVNREFEVVMLSALNEKQVLVVQETGYYVKNADEIVEIYPSWEMDPRPAEKLTAKSEAWPAVETALEQKYEVETVHIRWLRQDENRIFCIFSAGTQTDLRAVVLEKNEDWSVLIEDVTEYKACFEAYPDINGSMFPFYSIQDVHTKKLTSGGISQLQSFLRNKKKIDRYEKMEHYCYIGSYVYVKTDGGKEWVIALTEKGKAGECFSPKEALANWELPPFLCDISEETTV